MDENGAKTELGTEMQANSKMEGLRCNFMKSCFCNFSCANVEENIKRGFSHFSRIPNRSFLVEVMAF